VTIKHPVKYVKKKDLGLIDLDNYPSAGPYPSVTGMRKKFWGENACIIKNGVYIYKVPKEVYDRF
jgi:hypothetical protein